MNIYKILRLVAGNKVPAPVKLGGMIGMHLLGRRVIGIFIDPVNACNLRCKMCYFSDPAKRAELKGVMTEQEIDAAEKAFFHRALKLQIGCGTEPTLYKGLTNLVRRGKNAGIPFISLTTNGQLIADGTVNLEELCAAGLNEITISMHGTRRATYEELMPGAKYDNLIKLIEIAEEARRKFPDFSIRVNFTINSLNVSDLTDDSFWKLWNTKGPDILQLRPVQKIGESEWQDFSIDKIKGLYDQSIGRFIKECANRGVTCMAPDRSQLDQVASQQSACSAAIEDFTYCYIAPHSLYKADFQTDADTFESYHRRKKTVRHLIAVMLGFGKKRTRKVSKKLNYNIN